jgi:F420-dependent oxidoreductase-like protein
MRIGIMTGGAGSVEEQVQSVVDAENAGFDNVWFGQIFGTDAMTVIALAGQRTSRVEIGTSVVPTYPRHPFVMAQQAMTVQAATDGRFVLGIGLSHHIVIENVWGMSYDKPARHMREYLSVLNPLLNEGKVAFKGEVFSTAASLQAPGVRPPAVMIAALAPMMLRIAGELTAGTITWMTGTKTIATHVAPRINAAAQAAGRPAPRVCVGLPIAVTDDVAAGKERAGQVFALYNTLPNYRRMLDIEGAAGPADVAIVGDEASVERQLRDLASAGATDFFAPILPVGDDAKASLARTTDLLKGLVGRI